jgi:hypothetical protein
MHKPSHTYIANGSSSRFKADNMMYALGMLTVIPNSFTHKCQERIPRGRLVLQGDDGDAKVR